MKSCDQRSAAGSPRSKQKQRLSSNIMTTKRAGSQPQATNIHIKQLEIEFVLSNDVHSSYNCLCTCTYTSLRYTNIELYDLTIHSLKI